MKSTNYNFATGKIRYLETKLPDKTDIERMVDAPDLNSCLKALYDTDYADNLLEVEPADFEKAVFDDLEQAKDLLYQIVPDKEFIKFLLLDFDFHNLKVLFKEKLFGKDTSYLLSSLAYFKASDLKKYLAGDKKILIDLEIKEIIDQASQKLTNKVIPYKIEPFFDKQYFILLTKITKRLKNKFLTNFVTRQIDLTNFRIFLRIKNLDKDINFLQEFLIDGGNIEKEEFIKIFKEDLKLSLPRLAKFLPFRCEKYFNEYVEKNILWLLEKRLFDEEIEYLKKVNYIAFGPEIVLAYFYAKKNANKNIRLIMNGKLNKIDASILKERLRKLY